MTRKDLKLYRSAGLAFLATLLCQLAWADPFLQPAALPGDLKQLKFEDSQSGKSVTVRLDDNHLPVRQDFFNEDVPIPFYIEGYLVDSSSGSRLHAWEVIPKSDLNGISILLLHGNGGNILTNLGAGIALAKRGFKVTIFDYSGYGYSTGKATRENLLEDAESILRHISSDHPVKEGKLVLYGQSLGGHLAVVVGARNPAAMDALVIEGAFSSHRAMAAQVKGLLGRAFAGEPYSAEESIVDYVKPILVIHSREDEVVPFAMGQSLYAAATGPKMFLEIDQAHLAGLAHYADQIAEKIVALVDMNHSAETPTD